MQTPVYTPEQRKGMANDPSMPDSVLSGMSDDQFAATYDTAYRKADPLRASENSYSRFDPEKNSLGNNIARNIRPVLGKVGETFGNVYRNGYMGAGAAGAGVGLLAGALLNEVLKRRAGGEDNYSGPSSLKAGLLGALAVGGGALLAHHNNNNIVKSSSYLDLTTVVANAQGLSQSEKMALAQGIRQLSASEEQVLSRQLRGVAGAAIGAIIGKFLLSKGLLGPIGGAIIGGLLGFGSQSTKTNILGQQYKPYNF